MSMVRKIHRLGRSVACWVGALVWCSVSGPEAWAQTRFTYAANGAEVKDAQTGLTWRRCSAGQSWNGSTCTGEPTSYTHEEALAYAQTQTGWRLPNVKELASIVDRSKSDPAIDARVFPGTASNWYWTSSPVVGNSGFAWGVDFGNGNGNGSGSVHYSPRNGNYHVRLVR